MRGSWYRSLTHPFKPWTVFRYVREGAILDAMRAQGGGSIRRARSLTPRIEASLVCPTCRVTLAVEAGPLVCPSCHVAFPNDGGQIDLRPVGVTRVSVDYEVGHREPVRYLDRVGPMAPRQGSTHDPRAIHWSFDASHGSRMTPALFTHVPDRPPEGGILVDLGCGDPGHYAELLRHTGFDYVGVDVAGRAPDILADAHRLPFRDGSIDVVVAISVLEHLRSPAVALREMHRVLKPGGTLIGSVALVEPFHMDSYYHHTHLGALDALSEAGFEVDALSPTADWSGLQAYAEMALFPGFWRGSWLAALPVVRTVEAASRLWWWLLARTGRVPRVTGGRTLLVSSGFRFVAHRPEVRPGGGGRSADAR